MGDIIKSINDAFDDLGHNNDDMARDRPYYGQPHTCTGKRGATEIKGITFRDLRDAYIRAVFLSAHHQTPHLYEQANNGENAMIAESYLYTLNWNDLDPMAIQQNLSCEIEKLMGIYPNVEETPPAKADEKDGGEDE